MDDLVFFKFCTVYLCEKLLVLLLGATVSCGVESSYTREAQPSWEIGLSANKTILLEVTTEFSHTAKVFYNLKYTNTDINSD